MPYETKLSRDSREWMTLSQAVHYVASVEDFHSQTALSKDSPSAPNQDSFVTVEREELSFKWMPHPPHLHAALSQILLALQDEEIPIKWAAEGYLAHWRLHRDLLFALDDPPTGRYFWSTAIILPSEDYAVRDQGVQLGSLETEYAVITDRGLRRLLLLQSRVQELWPKKTPGNLSDAPAKKPVPSQDMIRTEARNVYRNFDPKPNIADAEVLIRKALPSAKRDLIRRVLNESEFESQRRPAGNSKTKR